MLKGKLYGGFTWTRQICTQLLTASFGNKEVHTWYSPSASKGCQHWEGSVITPFTLKSLEFSLLLFWIHLYNFHQNLHNSWTTYWLCYLNFIFAFSCISLWTNDFFSNFVSYMKLYMIFSGSNLKINFINIANQPQSRCIIFGQPSRNIDHSYSNLSETIDGCGHCKTMSIWNREAWTMTLRTEHGVSPLVWRLPVTLYTNLWLSLTLSPFRHTLEWMSLQLKILFRDEL